MKHLGFGRIIVFVVLTHTTFGAARVTSSLYALSNRASAFTVGVVIAQTGERPRGAPEPAAPLDGELRPESSA